MSWHPVANGDTSKDHRELLLGLDIGGTKIGLCVGTREGRVLASAHVPVDHSLAPASMLERCTREIDGLLARAGGGSGGAGSIAAGSIAAGSVAAGSVAAGSIAAGSIAAGSIAAGSVAARSVAGLGCACPGPFDNSTGKFINPPNNPTWHGFDLRAWLCANVGVPSVIMNDANAAAYSEWLWGAARGSNTAIFLTMSTGMGSGLIIDGRLFEGPGGLAGEIGQIRLTRGDDGPVGFGKRGSVEGYLSGPGMRQIAIQEAMIARQLSNESTLREVWERTGDITTQELCEAARAGDQSARRVTDRVALELGRLCAMMTDILNPDVIVLGTIGSAYPDLFIPGAMAEIGRESIVDSAKRVRVVASGFVPAERGDRQALAVATRCEVRAPC